MSTWSHSTRNPGGVIKSSHPNANHTDVQSSRDLINNMIVKTKNFQLTKGTAGTPGITNTLISEASDFLQTGFSWANRNLEWIYQVHLDQDNSSPTWESNDYGTNIFDNAYPSGNIVHSDGNMPASFKTFNALGIVEQHSNATYAGIIARYSTITWDVGYGKITTDPDDNEILAHTGTSIPVITPSIRLKLYTSSNDLYVRCADEFNFGDTAPYFFMKFWLFPEHDDQTH